MSDSNGEKITVTCTCGTTLRVPATAAGKRGKCPKCSALFRVPQIEEEIRIATEDEFDALAAAATREGDSDALEQPQDDTPPQACPQCGARIAAGVILCVSCGFNLQTGKTLKTAAETAEGRGLLERIGRRSGPFLLGCGLSALGALIGAAIWAGAALASGYEIGWIAWGLGAAAGFGMTLGYQERNQRAGLAAGGIALVGIGVAKIIIFVLVIQAMLTGETDNNEIRRSVLASQMAENSLDAREIWDEDARAAQWDQEFDEAYEEVSGYSAKQLEQEWRDYREDIERYEAIFDETGQKYLQVAMWNAQRRADGLRVDNDSSSSEAIYEEEFRKAKKLGPARVEAELAKIKAWENGGKWDDVDYVRAELLRAQVFEELAKRNEGLDEYRSLSDKEEEQLYREKAAIVDAMAPDARAAELKERNAGNEMEFQRERLAEHFFEIEAMRERLSYSDERREAIYERLKESFANVPAAELDEKIAELDRWEAGEMWSDAGYVRDRLIYQHADSQLAAKRAAHSDDETYWEPSPDEWKEAYDNAAEYADSALPAQHRNLFQELEKEEQRRWEEQWADQEVDESVETGLLLLGSFFEMFGVIDLFFMALAVFSAYRIASGGSDGSAG